ncbi:SpoIIE family protein phosphatase [candidate division KSB1 bacterium]|nr:SpoIIE family protein phosphatase [candidate division KSB1 bacterium]
MSLKLKLIILIICEIVSTVALVGFLSYRESKWKIKELARELLVSKTEQAFALCDHHYKNSLEVSAELKQEIADIGIAADGYVTVINNEDGLNKGVLIIHPTDVGKSLYNDDFQHIKDVLDEIDLNDGVMGYSNLIYYHQGTNAKGRQGEKKIGYFKYFAPWHWVILATGYEKDVFASRDQLRATLIPLVVLVMLAGSVVVYLTIGQMFRPIQRLTESTKEVAKGNWDISIDYKSNDEIGALAQSFDKMVQSLRENARMWHEFKVARDMQAQMLPDTYPEIEGIQISAKSVPTTEVGGDFYDFLQLQDGRLGIVVGDVSGHGVAAAMVMTAALGAVRFAAEEKECTHEVLNMVNFRLNKDIQNHMFVALFYGILDPKTRKLYYTNAGQTMPFLLRNGEIDFLPQAEKTDRFPLGIVKATVYEQLSIELQPGDMLIHYTDGIVDVMNGSHETYGFDRLSESIKQNASLPPSELIDKLIAEMSEYGGDSNIEDDVTLVVLKFS